VHPPLRLLRVASAVLFAVWWCCMWVCVQRPRVCWRPAAPPQHRSTNKQGSRTSSAATPGALCSGRRAASAGMRSARCA
jgi:hypothetical protein